MAEDQGTSARHYPVTDRFVATFSCVLCVNCKKKKFMAHVTVGIYYTMRQQSTLVARIFAQWLICRTHQYFIIRDVLETASHTGDKRTLRNERNFFINHVTMIISCNYKTCS